MGTGFIDAEVFQCLANIEIGLARRHDAETPLWPIKNCFVQLVGASEGAHGVQLMAMEAFFLLQWRVGPANVQAAFGHFVVGRFNDIDPCRVDINRGGAVGGFGDDFECHPAAGKSRHGPAIETQVDEFLYTRGVQHRNHGVAKREFRLMRGGGGFAGVVVARQEQHAAIFRRPGEVAVTENISGAVNARTFGVPQTEHTVVIRAGEHTDLLAAPDCCGGEIFVNARLKFNVVFFDERPCLP